MARTPGSGRPKGARNKSSVIVKELADAMGVCPMEILLHFAAGHWRALGYEKKTELKYTKTGASYEVDIISPDMRLKAAVEASRYLYPQLKSIEIKDDREKPRPLKDIPDEELDKM